MWTSITILALVTLQRLLEFIIARRNTKKLIARGGFEVGSNRHWMVVILQAAWLAALWYFVLYQNPAVDMRWIYAYLVLEAGRGWVVAAFGSRFTTKVIVMPGENLPDEGFASWLRHSNYLVVAAEIFILPMAFNLWWLALIFGVLNLALLGWRMRSEDTALKPLREEPASEA